MLARARSVTVCVHYAVCDRNILGGQRPQHIHTRSQTVREQTYQL